jgi:hypothetical protein
MARRTCIFFISLLLLPVTSVLSQDTVTVPLHIRAALDVSSPVMKLVNKELISYGVTASADLNSSLAVTAGLRYSSYNSSKAIYDFSSKGLSFTAGTDYNFLKANVSRGRYYAGIGLRYGLSFYSEEARMIRYTNEWGAGETFMPAGRHTGHFLEITPGVRTELFPGVTAGWNLYMRLLISAGAGKDLKPVWMPGYGRGTSGMATGAEYYISISIPYRKIRVFIKPKTSDSEEDETEGDQAGEVRGSGTSGPGSRL